MEVNNDKTHLKTLKTAIEHKTGWGDSSQWATKDFEHLSEAIFDATQVNISVTTLKRLLGKVHYAAQPRLTTLDAIAQYLTYENWRSFKQAIINESTDRKNAYLSKGKCIISKRRAVLKPILIGGLGVTVCMVMLLMYRLVGTKNTSNAKEYKDIGSGSFNIRKVSKGLPNTVVFSYDISGIHSNKVQIQQHWDKTKRIDIDKQNTEVTCLYYYPGYFRAKLVADDKIIQEKDLFIASDGWLAAIEGKAKPQYILPEDLIQKEALQLSETMKANIASKEPIPLVNYFYFRDFQSLPGTDFIFETSFRHTLKTGKNICQRMNVIIVGTQGVLSIPFSAPGCIGALRMFLNGQRVQGKHRDLSGFGCDFTKTQQLKVINKQNSLTIYLNNHSIYQHKLKNDIGNVAGVKYLFKGYGEVDYIKYSKINGYTVFQEDFE